MGRRYTLPCAVRGLCCGCAETTAKHTAMANDAPVEITLTHEQIMGPNETPFVRRVR